MQSEVLGFFEDFYEQWLFERSLNATYLVLIPKKKKKKTRVEDLNDFTPISLMGSW